MFTKMFPVFRVKGSAVAVPQVVALPLPPVKQEPEINRETWACCFRLATDDRLRAACLAVKASDLSSFIRDLVEDGKDGLLTGDARVTLALELGSLWRIDWKYVESTLAPHRTTVDIEDALSRLRLIDPNARIIK